MNYKYIIAAVLAIAIVYMWYISRSADVSGVWFVPHEIVNKYGLNQFVMYLDRAQQGFLILVDAKNNIIYCDSIAYSVCNKQL